MAFQHITIPVSIKPSTLEVNGILVNKNIDTFVFTQIIFYCFEVNVGYMSVTRKHPHRQRANMCHFVFI